MLLTATGKGHIVLQSKCVVTLTGSLQILSLFLVLRQTLNEEFHLVEIG